MARVRNLSKPAIWIWIISSLTFYALFLMAIRNSTVEECVSVCAHVYICTHARTHTVTPHKFRFPNKSDTRRRREEWSISNAEQRSKLYHKMEKDLEEHGAAFLKQGETTQSLSLSDLFALKDGVVTPVLKAANPPVRANVLYLNPEYSTPIAEAVRDIFLPNFDKAIWFQNSSLFHFSMFHASHHITAIPASEAEIQAEANAVKAVSETICPLKIALDRVVLTSTGVLVGCWQVESGTDPVTIRQKLRNVLPRAPAKQLYDAVMLHTSFARLLGHPSSWSEDTSKVTELQFLHELVTRLNDKIRDTKATVSELWYVEEYDILALALDGRMEVRKFQLGCSKV